MTLKRCFVDWTSERKKRCREIRINSRVGDRKHSMDFDSEFLKVTVELGVLNMVNINRVINIMESNTERILMIAEICNKYPCLSSLLKQSYSLHQQELAKPLKTATLSDTYRLNGNHFFKKKLYIQAMGSYNQSIQVGEGEHLALAYANRSAVLFSNNEWLYSLRDIQLALDNNYPKHIEYKLRERQGNCWFLLKEKKLAIASFRLAKNLLISYPIEDSAKLNNISSKLSKLEVVDDFVENVIDNVKLIEEKIKEQRRVPPKLYGESNNRFFQCASSAVELSEIPGKGRGLIATEDIELGATVVVEKAHTSILMREFNETHCHYCLHWTPAPVPCLRCPQVVFCSTICREEAWTNYHKHECGFFDLLQRKIFNEMHLLTLRTVLKADRQTLMRACLCKNEQLRNEIFKSTNYGPVHRLTGHPSKFSEADIFRQSIMILYMLGLLRGDELGVEYLASELLHLHMHVPFNAFSIRQTFLPPKARASGLATASIETIGMGVMPFSSFANHSCDPNVTRTFYGDIMTFRVYRSIKRGDEITTGYGNHYTSYPKDKRQSTLKANYYFDCTCRACIECWPHRLQQLTGRPRLILPILSDLNEFQRLECWYPGDLQVIEKWEKIFIKHLKSLGPDRNIPHPIHEFTLIQDTLNQCYDLMATTCPVVEKKMASSVAEQMFRNDYRAKIGGN